MAIWSKWFGKREKDPEKIEIELTVSGEVKLISDGINVHIDGANLSVQEEKNQVQGHATSSVEEDVQRTDRDSTAGISDLLSKKIIKQPAVKFGRDSDAEEGRT